MATRFPQINPTNIPLDTFARVEQEIRTYFDTIISAVTIRRDELIQQLNDLKQDYLSKEDLRKKQVQELGKMIGQLDDMSVHQNPNLKLHENHLKTTKEELKKAEQPTPVSVPHFSSDLQYLLQQLERIGTVQESPATKTETEVCPGVSVTLWETWEVKGSANFTVEEFIKDIDTRFQIKPTAIVQGVKMVYVPLMPGHSKRLNQPISKYITPNESENYVDLVVACEDAAGEEINGPPIRYFPA